MNGIMTQIVNQIGAGMGDAMEQMMAQLGSGLGDAMNMNGDCIFRCFLHENGF